MLVLVFGCQPPSPPDMAVMHIVPNAGDEWSVLTTSDEALSVNGDMPTGVRTVFSGTRRHEISFGSAKIELPIRQSDTCSQVRFAALGDGRAHIDHLGPSAYWPGMLAEVAQHRPEFILNTGDLVKRGHRIHEWIRFLRQTPIWPPMISVRGNHDRGGLFEELQAVSTPVFWFRWGPVLVLGLDTEGPDSSLSTVTARAKQVLSTQTAPWIIVMLHRPIWSRGNHGSDERGWNTHLVPLFDHYGVDLVLAGHDHNYERFCSSRGVGARRRCVPPSEGTTYVVTGGAATFTNPVPGVSRRVSDAQAKQDQAASRFFSGAHHFLMVHATPESLKVRAHKTRTGNVFGGGLLDSFELRKSTNSCLSQRRKQ